jgi:hypothetical protein
MEAPTMTSESVRAIIREVLAEELQRFKAGSGAGVAPRPQVREERVHDRLRRRSRRLRRPAAGADQRRPGRREIEDQRHVFRLAPGPAPSERAASPARPVVHAARIDKGMVSERQIDALPPGTSQLVIGKSVRLTPLARDRARARGINLERAS